MATGTRIKNIAVIEDEPSIQEALRYNLEHDGHGVMAATDGLSGLALARSDEVDLVILDIALPGMNGMDVCRTLRYEGSTVPIIMLTARAEDLDRVVGLELGADDYVTKPFNMRELLARVNSLLRRVEMDVSHSISTANGETTLVFDVLQIDLLKRVVKSGCREATLKPREFDLLVHMASNTGRVFTRQQLLESVWESEYLGVRTVDVHVLGIRKEIEDDPAQPVRLVTVRGVGYRFDP